MLVLTEQIRMAHSEKFKHIITITAVAISKSGTVIKVEVLNQNETKATRSLKHIRHNADLTEARLDAEPNTVIYLPAYHDYAADHINHKIKGLFPSSIVYL